MQKENEKNYFWPFFAFNLQQCLKIMYGKLILTMAFTPKLILHNRKLENSEGELENFNSLMDSLTPCWKLLSKDQELLLKLLGYPETLWTTSLMVIHFNGNSISLMEN